MSTDDLFEVEIIFKGEVQGVGFRATIAKLSNQIGLFGTVCNLPDGSVKVVAQGTDDAINSLVMSLKLKFNISEVLFLGKTKPVTLYAKFNVTT